MNDPYLAGPYAPVDREVEHTLVAHEGQIPRDVAGTYVRNGPNPRHTPVGLHHWFDGDGMLHALHVGDGALRYQNRYVRTPAWRAEDDAGRALWRGLMEPFTENPPHAPVKDTGNTDVLAYAGELLTFHYLCGPAHRVDPRTLETLGEHRFGRERPLRMSAHAKADPRTGELLFFDYGPRAPYLRYGVIEDGALAHRVDIDLPGPRLPHDMAFTERYAILMDLPVHFRAEAITQKKHMVAFHRDVPARFGILPRRGAGSEIRWFEAEPCYVYHAVNAWEEDGAVVMIGCRCDDPLGTPDPADGPYKTALANLRLRAHFYRWRFDLTTGETTEGPLCDRNAEFPALDARAVGRRSRVSYHMSIPKTPTLLFDGVVKYDAERGAVAERTFGEGIHGAEVAFAPRAGSDVQPDGSHEDDGYLFTLVHDSRQERSEAWILDAKDLAVVAKAVVPARVPLGFHATWAPAAEVTS